MHRCVLLLFFLSLLAVPCGAASIHLIGTPPQYRLEASGFQQVAAIDVTIIYDPVALRVEAMEVGPLLRGTLAASNINLPGKIRLGAVTTTPLSGSGLLGTLQVQADGLPLLEVKATLRGLDGQSIPVSTHAPASNTPLPSMPDATPSPATPPQGPAPPTADGDSSLATPSAGGSTVTIIPRSLFNDTATRTTPAASPTEAPRPDRRSPAAAGEGRSAALPRLVVVDKEERLGDSPLALFRQQLSTIRSLEDVARLSSLPPGMRQDPFPVLSDGRTRVLLRVEKVGPQASLGVQGARLLESWRGQDGILRVELLPAVGTTEIDVVIIDEMLRTVRLVAAPPLALDPCRTDSDYLTHWHDVDGDGIITLDEAWIVAVNLLARAGAEKPPGCGSPLLHVDSPKAEPPP
jgi:hypothetical protein